MIRLSKIFKKYDQPRESPPGDIKPEVPPREEIGAEETIVSNAPGGRHKPIVRLSDSLNAELESDKLNTPNVANLYNELVAKARAVYTSGPGAKRDFMSELKEPIEKVKEFLAPGSDGMLIMALRDYAKPEDMLYCHVVNTSIIALAVGLGIGYDSPRMLELGISAFVHDIGLKDSEILNKPDVFSDEEFDKVKLHPNDGALALSELDPRLNQRIIDAVKQEHERADGSGYPDGLAAEEISEYAQVIGLADVYEALMHNRPYRDKYTSIETIRIILKNKKLFSVKVIKALIEAFGIFPPETLVQLSTKEIGVIVKRDPELISRPVVDIIIDPYGKALKQPKRIIMANNPIIYIDDCVKKENGQAKPSPK